MENEELVRRVQQGDSKAKEQLCVQNRGLVCMVSKRLAGLGEIEDLQQEGFIGLLKAAETFDPERGVKFSTYAAKCIFGSIFRNVWTVPEHIKSKVLQYRCFCESYTKRTGSAPTDAMILCDLDLTQEELMHIRSAESIEYVDSLQQSNDEGRTLEEIIPDDADMAETVEDQILREELSATIWKEVASLPEDQAETIRAKYQDGKSISEISKKIPGARGAESKALRELRKRKSLLPFYEDIRSEGMKGTGIRRFQRTWTSATERAAFKDLGYLI